ncbi:hypothetical protein AAG906_015911 [Vitis piasezkii]
MEGTEGREDRSLAETPTWAFATVVAVMVAFGFFFHFSLKHFKKWLEKTKRKSLLAALEKMKDELMLFGLLSLLMGHWTLFVAKICVKTSVLSSRFYPCVLESDIKPLEHIIVSDSNYFNDSAFPDELTTRHNYCPKGQESFASYESLEQLHRLLFVLGVIHVSYSFVTIALAMIKIYSWRRWEDQAKSMAIQGLQGSYGAAPNSIRMRRLSTFIFHHTSHPWSQHRVFVWLLCFSRQFWSSINRADYMALRLGFITTHGLHLSYDFHNYMLRSMEEEFRDIVGISVPLWIYAISCIFLNFHGTNVYYWLSFLPAILILLVGTKLHRIVVKLAVEIMDTSPQLGNHQVKLRDELFWFGRPKLLLWLIQLISFQNAFEMSTFIWSLWEIRGPSCFMENRNFAVIRLIFGVVSQFWCSFITFPLYVIITQMGSRFKKTIMSENVRKSLHGWQRRVKARHSGAPFPLLTATSTSSLSSLCPLEDEMDRTDHVASSSKEGSYSILEDTSTPYQPVSLAQSPSFEVSPSNKSPVPLHCDPIHDSYHSDEEEDQK